YVMSLRRRRMDDVRAIVQPDPASDRRFAAAARFSDLGLGFYRQFVQPWVRAAVTPVNADLVQKFHPMRIQYEWWSDRHPLAALVAKRAAAVRAARRPADPGNPWLQCQQAFAQTMVTALDAWRDVRDHAA